VELVASGISVYDMLRTEFGAGHYWIQARTGADPETATLSVAEPITVGNPPPVGLTLAANAMKSADDGTAYLDGLSRDFERLEPILKMVTGAAGPGNALQEQMTQAMIQQMMAPAPDPVEEMIRMKRAMAEMFPTSPVAAPVAPAGGWGAAVNAISNGLTLLNRVTSDGATAAQAPTPTPQPTPAQAVANAAPPEDLAQTSAADATAGVSDDALGAWVVNKILEATNTAHPSPPNIAQAALEGFDLAKAEAPDHWIVRLFPTDPGQVFDLLWAHADSQITASADLMAAARDILVQHVEGYNAAEGAPVYIDGDAADDEAPVDVQDVEGDAIGDQGSPDVRRPPAPGDADTTELITPADDPAGPQADRIEDPVETRATTAA